MPLTINVGLSRKMGEPNYGSRGANANFEVEVEASLVDQPEQLMERIRYLFGLAREAIEVELNGHGGQAMNGQVAQGLDGSRPSNLERLATASQIGAIHAIANRHGIELVRELRDRFSVETPAELSITAASQLIDSLKSLSHGTGGQR
jgi:hypothetical protein